MSKLVFDEIIHLRQHEWYLFLKIFNRVKVKKCELCIKNFFLLVDLIKIKGKDLSEFDFY